MLTKFDSKVHGWRVLAKQFTEELGADHSMTKAAYEAAYRPGSYSGGLKKANFLDYDGYDRLEYDRLE
jgi:hypothetical protein